MYFILSKTVGALVDPWRLCIACVAVALLLRWRHFRPRLRRWLVIVGVGQLLLLSTRGAAELLLMPLEAAYARPAKLPSDPTAVVVLTGMLYDSAAGTAEFSGAADRLIWGVRLAHRFAHAKLIISGGKATLLGGGHAEATVLAQFARGLGLPRARVLVEAASRNTIENARFSKVLVDKLPRRGPVILVTSAFHMTRAVGCFRKVGVAVVPWPVDYLRRGLSWRAPFPGVGDLAKSSAAVHEYIGLLTYWIAGYM